MWTLMGVLGCRAPVSPAALAPEEPAVTIHTEDPQQTMLGFGASFTESAGYVWQTLPPDAQAALVHEAFSPDALGFSLARTHIGSTDYALGHYAYVPEGATDLGAFSMEREAMHLRPLVQAALDVPGAEFRIIASPWSPPAWLKDSGAWIGGRLLPEHDAFYAAYLSRYLTEQQRLGIPIWGITPQNEPMHEGNWDTCGWTAERQRDFLRDHLGPQLAADGHEAVKVLIFDHNKRDLPAWVSVIMSDPEAAKYVWGAAFHWYDIHDGETSDYGFRSLDMVRSAYPGLALLHTESSIDIDADDPVGQFFREGPWDWTKRPFVPFDQYARDLIGDLEHGAVGYIEWNLILDTTGGPNPYNNFNSAPYLVDVETHEVIRTPLWGLLAQLSAHVRPGARRLPTSGDEPLWTVAFRNPNGEIAVVAYNPLTEAAPLRLQIDDHTAQAVVRPGSVLTAVVSADGGTAQAWETGPQHMHAPTAVTLAP